jgi:hypothetical protein
MNPKGRNLEMKSELMDSLVEEVCLFISLYLEESFNLDEIIEDLLEKLPSIEEAEFSRIKALLFKELEDQCWQIKTKATLTSYRQLELFPEFPDQGLSQGPQSKEIGICRARAFLQTSSVSTDSLINSSPLTNDSVFANQIVSFAMQRRLEELVEVDEDLNQTDFVRCFQVTHYLLELLPEVDAVEVEKKFMQDPLWQSEKRMVSKIVKWFECASQFDDSVHSSYSIKLSQKVREGLLQLLQNSVDRKETELPLSSSKDKVGKLPAGGSIKDKWLRFHLVVGLICLIIGYLGWVERSQEQKISEKKDELIDVGRQGAETFPGIDQASQIAFHQAHQAAAYALAETTESSIKEMEKQLQVPHQLLVSGAIEKRKILPPEITGALSNEQFLKPAIGMNRLRKALSEKEGYLFRPGQESMGKIVNIKQEGERFLFERADWPHSVARFGLSVSDYEIRLGSQEEGFVVLIGSVRRKEDENDYSEEHPVYILEPSQAWWLDQNQNRKELDLFFLNVQ